MKLSPLGQVEVHHYVPNVEEAEEHRVVNDGDCWCGPTAVISAGATHELVIYVHRAASDRHYNGQVATWTESGRHIRVGVDEDPDWKHKPKKERW